MTIRNVNTVRKLYQIMTTIKGKKQRTGYTRYKILRFYWYAKYIARWQAFYRLK